MKSGDASGGRIPSPPAGERNSKPRLIVVPPKNSKEPCFVDATYQHETLWRVYLDADPLKLLGEFETPEMAGAFVRDYDVSPT